MILEYFLESKIFPNPGWLQKNTKTILPTAIKYRACLNFAIELSFILLNGISTVGTQGVFKAHRSKYSPDHKTGKSLFLHQIKLNENPNVNPRIQKYIGSPT